MAEYRIWPATNGPVGSLDNGQPISCGTEFYTTSQVWANRIWYWRADTTMAAGGAMQGQIYQIDGGGTGTALLTVPVVFPAPSTTGWQSVDIDPLQLTVNQHYKVVVLSPNGKYAAHPGNNYWNTGGGGPGENGIINGPLKAVSTSEATDGQSSFADGAVIQYPTGNFNAGNYWIDVGVTDANPAHKQGAFMSFFQ